MKFLLLLAVVGIVLWLLRTSRPPIKPTVTKQDQAKSPQPQAMATCPACGVHFPTNDGVQGRIALYCSESHRSTAEA